MSAPEEPSRPSVQYAALPFRRLKKGGFVVCEVFVFPLEVKRQQKSWPEKGRRQIQWLSLTRAAATVEEGALGEIIRSMQTVE
jgi:hypothetical protein